MIAISTLCGRGRSCCKYPSGAPTSAIRGPGLIFNFFDNAPSATQPSPFINSNNTHRFAANGLAWGSTPDVFGRLERSALGLSVRGPGQIGILFLDDLRSLRPEDSEQLEDQSSFLLRVASRPRAALDLQEGALKRRLRHPIEGD